MRLSRLTIAQKGLLIVLIPVVSQLLMLAITAAIDRLREADRAAESRSREITVSADRVLGLLVDVETGIRGYILTANPEFAQPYDDAVAMLPAELARLSAQLTRSGHDPRTFERIRAAAEAFVRFEIEQRDLVASGQRQLAMERSGSGVGKRLMDDVRKMMSQLVAERQAREARREAESDRSSSLLAWAIGADIIFTVVFGIAAATLFTRNVSGRLSTVVENTRLLEEGLPLKAPLGGEDEVAILDARFHEMSDALERSRHELEATNGQLESFSYSVSHDLRAPLRAVQGYAQMLEEDCGDAVGAEGRRFIGVIRGEARRMGSLIDDLLAFSRLGRAGVHPAALDIGDMAAVIVRELEGTSPKPIELRLGEMPRAMGDASMVRQALTNLLSNAVKFSAPRDTIVIDMSGTSRDGWSEYVIRDYGVGFDPRHAGQLFGVFQRLHSDAEFEGTGVGLAIVKRVIERHGGEIRAEGMPGEGAQFVFTLPAAEGA